MTVGILDAVSADYTGIPATVSISAGSDRVLFVAVGFQHGTEAFAFSSMTYGGQTMTSIGYPGGAGYDAKARIWMLDEIGIAAAEAVPSTTLTAAGGSYTGIGSFVWTMENAVQTRPVRDNAAVNGTSGSISLARAADSITFYHLVHDENGNMVLSDPAINHGNNISDGNTCLGYAVDTARTASGSWTHASPRDNSSVLFNVATVIAIAAGYQRIPITSPELNDNGYLGTGYTDETPVTDDSWIVESVTTPDSHAVTIAADGGICLTGLPTRTQTFDFYVEQLDGTEGTTATYTYTVDVSSSAGSTISTVSSFIQ